MAKHFTLTIADTDFSFARKQDAIDAEARLDGIYLIRTNLEAPTLDDSATVRAYKSRAQVERAIRSIKTVDLQIRPIFHWAAPRVRAHVLLCMLAYHLEWHLRQRLAPMLYDDADRAAAEARRTSVVAKAQRSPSAIAKQTHGTTPDGLPGAQPPNPSRRSRHARAKHRHHRAQSGSRVRRGTPVRLCSSKRRSIPRRKPHHLYPVDPRPRTKT
jgi:hypothetical protein